MLRQHDVYLTASEDDPCSNALVEALSCGLPAVYRRSGGHPELVKDGGVAFDRTEDIPTCLDALSSDYAAIRARVAAPAMSEVAAAYLSVMGIA